MEEHNLMYKKFKVINIVLMKDQSIVDQIDNKKNKKNKKKNLMKYK
jgi:hypothetical protein